MCQLPKDKEKLKMESIQNFMKGDILVAILFIILTFVFLDRSPLHPLIRGESGIDSSVFRTVALMMRHGLVPYRDSFDHKGPLIYFINYVGNVISRSWGIWAIEYITIFISALFMYRIARIWTNNKIYSIISVLTGMSLLFKYYEGGNFVEEYSMPFIAASLFIFCDYIVNSRVSRRRLAICGFCLGCVFLLRINMAAVWVVFCAAIFFKFVFERRIKELVFLVIWFLVGFAVSILPVLIWLWANGALVSFGQAYIKFNVLYSSAEGGRAVFSTRWNAFFEFTNTFAFTMSIGIAVFLFYKKDRFLYGSLIACQLLNLLLMSMSGQTYGHYGMILIPVIAALVSGFFSYLEGENNAGRLASMIVAGFLLCFLIVGDWQTDVQEYGTVIRERKNGHISDTTMQVCSLIKEMTSEQDTISVYGNYDIIYVESERRHATRFSYQLPIGSVDPGIMDTYWAQMEKEKPKIFVIAKWKYNDSNVQEFIQQNGYRLLWASNYDSINDGVAVFCLAGYYHDAGITVDLENNPNIELSNSILAENQYYEKPGVICRGKLDRENNDGANDYDYLRDEDYIGLKYTVEDISQNKLLMFCGKKTRDHGQPSVYIYDKEGNMVRECTDSYQNIDDTWKQYIINVADLSGEVTIMFNGGYTDSEGSDDSEYVFSDITLY